MGLGFQKFAIRPNPDFIVQMIAEYQEEAMAELIEATKDNPNNETNVKQASDLKTNEA